MTQTSPVVDNWLPRRFVSRSAHSNRDHFERTYGDTLFLLVKLNSYTDALAVGLEATCVVEPPTTLPTVTGFLSTSAEATEATGVTSVTARGDTGPGEDWIATAVTKEPRFVVPVRKRLNDNNPRISVGRSYSADIVLREHTVSKLHAHFELNAQGDWVLVDRGSKNHTWLNGIRMTTSSVVQPGTLLRFGRVEAKMCSPLALWNRLAAV